MVQQENNMRTFFGKPIRKGTTELFFPDKCDIYYFADYLGLRPQHSFITNMQHLGGKAFEDKYIEEWTEQFLAWSEIEQEP